MYYILMYYSNINYILFTIFVNICLSSTCTMLMINDCIIIIEFYCNFNRVKKNITMLLTLHIN